ncbi:MAG: class I adenylate-forming enzyme family protein [Pararhodobacter sp.]
MTSGEQAIDMSLGIMAAGLTMGGLFAETLRRCPDDIALQEGDRCWSYAELDRRTAALCRHWQRLGLTRGDRVAILSENRAEYVECLVAAARMGVILACQNWRQADPELTHCLSLVTPSLLVVSPRHADAARRCAGDTPLLMLGDAYEAALASAPQGAPLQDPCTPEDGLVILYTSGTTGLPKGALISHRAEIARSMLQMIDLPTGRDEAFVAWAPLFHMVSTDTVFMTLVQGGKVIVTDGFVPDELALIVGRERLGRLTLMPGMITPFIEAMKRLGVAPAGVKWAGVMADLVPREQIAEVTRLLGAPYLNSFGATETGLPPASRGMIPVGMVPETLDKQQSSFCQIRLVDTEGNDVPDGTPGELAIRSPALFSGYWNNPQANREDFRNGWFHMGDMFRRNPDGTLTFVDRRKYLIKSGGENIYPAEIERVLLAEPGVVDAVVVRKRDDHWGEVPVAFVVTGDDRLTADALRGICARAIARYKVPREFHLVSESDLPRSTTGKIKRHDLENRLEGPER